ncbi:MAG: PIN domain-containing protein [Caulobacteraceae bacterium]
MIAADTSSFIAFLHSPADLANAAVRQAIESRALRLPPPVKTELLSAPLTGAGADGFIEAAPLLPLVAGFWERAGLNRRLLRSKGLKARLADTLIAQCCIDSDVALLTRDADFRHFARWAGLKLA